MNTAQRAFHIVALVVSGLTAGCSTPGPVLEMASQGALSTDRYQAEAKRFVDRATQSYKRREAIVLGLATGDVIDGSRGDFDAWLAGEAGYTEDRANAELIKKIVEKSRITREKTQAELEKKTSDISSSFGAAVTVPDKQVAEAKKAFMALAQELTASEWRKFGIAYAKQLQSDLKVSDKTTPTAAVVAAPPSK